MDTKTLKVYRKRLVDQKTDITKGYDKTRAQGKQVDSEVSHDPVDKAANSYTKEFLFSLSNKERDEIQMIDDAIIRIDEKRFGACVVCGDDVERKRLEAVPWAKHCLSCQEKIEAGIL
jgi:DnaK suppressor protein